MFSTGMLWDSCGLRNMSVVSHTFCAQVSGPANAQLANDENHQHDCLNDGRSCVNEMIRWQILNYSLVVKNKVRRTRGTWVPNPADLPQKSVFEKYHRVIIVRNLEFESESFTCSMDSDRGVDL
jgi:hypothetical protein